MKVSIFLSLALIISISSYSQTWCEGSIEFDNGDRFEGLVSLDEDVGALYIKREATEETVYPNKVIQFQFLDSGAGHSFNRRFITLPLNQSPAFFEILNENRDFSYVRRIRLKILDSHTSSPIKSGMVRATGSVGAPFAVLGLVALASTRVGEAFTEEYYFINNEGTFFLFVNVMTKKSIVSKKEVHKNVLESIFGTHLAYLEEYAKKNKLKLDDPQDMIMIAGEYQSLIK